MQQKQLHVPGKVLKNYEIIKLVGSGGYAKVYLAKNILTQEEVAIKAVAMSTFKNHGGLVGKLHETEKQIMQLLNSEYVIKFIDQFQQNKYSYIVMEYCNQGDIEKIWLDSQKHFQEQQALLYIKQIVQAMKELNKNKIIHRDIKMKNILIHNNQVKLGDLGFRMLGYMAPEVVQSKPYTDKADIFSLGCLLFLMIYGELPFSDKNHQIYLQETKYKKIIHKEGIVSKEIQNLIDSMLKFEEKERISWNELFDLFELQKI